jgi:hypothetical protein
MQDNSVSTPPARDRLSQLDMEERWQARHRRHWVFDIFLTLVVLSLAAAAWYVYPMFKKHEAGIGQLPDMQKTVGELQDGLKSAGSRFDQWVSGQQSVSDRTQQALKELRGRVDEIKDGIKSEAVEATSAMLERVQSDIGTKIDKIQTQLAELDSGRKADREKAVALERDLAQLREQYDRQADGLAAIRRRMDEQEALSQRQIADVTQMKETQRQNRQDFDALNNRFATERVSFSVNKNQTAHVAPGITLEVTAIDPQFERVTGWMAMGADQRTIRFRNQAVHEPVEFYSADGRKRELVVTSVSKDSVAGYLLVPKAGGATATTSSAD